MKKIIFAIIFLLLSGCATATKTFTSDGKEGYVINCSGTDLDWGSCYEKSGEICGSKGYVIVEKMGDQDKSGNIVGNQSGIYGGQRTITHRNLIIRCKE
ncbi:MAG: hypothetical protein ABFD50_00455 [Smithella sp.]